MKDARTKFENIKIVNWNIAGAKYFEKVINEREIFKKNIQKALIRLIEDYDPDIITLQEVVNWGDKKNGGNKKSQKDKNDISNVVDIININYINEEIDIINGILEENNKLQTYEYFFSH